MHTEQHPCKSMQATKARRKNARSIAAAKQKHFWANFSNRKTEVDKSTNPLPRSLTPSSPPSLPPLSHLLPPSAHLWRE